MEWVELYKLMAPIWSSSPSASLKMTKSIWTQNQARMRDSKLGKRCVDSYDYDFGNRHGALQGSNSETVTSEHSHPMRKWRASLLHIPFLHVSLPLILDKLSIVQPLPNTSQASPTPFATCSHVNFSPDSSSNSLSSKNARAVVPPKRPRSWWKTLTWVEQSPAQPCAAYEQGDSTSSTPMSNKRQKKKSCIRVRWGCAQKDSSQCASMFRLCQKLHNVCFLLLCLHCIALGRGCQGKVAPFNFSLSCCNLMSVSCHLCVVSSLWERMQLPWCILDINEGRWQLLR